MSNSEMWRKFLDNIKEVISSTSFDIWFNENDTKLYSFKNDVATITVNQDFIKKHLAGKRIIMVSSMMADKDYNSYLSAVCPFADTFIATKADVPRALTSAELCENAKKFCKDCYDVSDPQKAVIAAHNIIQPDDALIICGSFYLAGEIRDSLLNF